MTTVLHRQFLVKTITFLTFFGLTISGHAQSDSNSTYDNPFAVRHLSFTNLDSNEMKKIISIKTGARINNINLQQNDIVCYGSSSSPLSKDTIRLAYSLENKTEWVSFVTPFRYEMPWDYILTNIDSKGKPEIVVRGTVNKQVWARGEFNNKAIIIYQIDSIPTQIFGLIYSCHDYTLNSADGKGGHDNAFERKIKIDERTMTIDQFDTPLLDDDNRYIWVRCNLTDIKSGTYKLINGQFKQQ